MKRIELQPRVHLNMMGMKKFKTNYISVEFKMPLREQTASHLALIPKVLDRGCSRYPDVTSLAKRCEELYGTGIWVYSGKSGESQSVSLGANPLRNEYAIDGMDILGETLDLMAQMIFDPVMENGAFLAEYVESEKRNLIHDIRAEINNKSRYAFNQMLRVMCKDEAFAISGMGTISQVEAITPISLTEAWRELLARAQVEIWFFGSADEQALTEKLGTLFAHLPAGEPEGISTEVIRKARGEVKYIDEVQPMKQGNLVMGLRSGVVLADGLDAYTPYTVFLGVYGSGTTSKLFMNVREKLSLCYYCSTGADAIKGTTYITSGIESANYEVAKKEILAQLEAVQSGDFTDEELENAKIGIINRYKELADEAGSLKNWYATRLMAGRSDSPDQCAEAVRNVTREQVIRSARGVSLDTVYFLHGSEASSDEADEEEEA